MARVKIQEIIEHLDSEMKKALKEAVKKEFPDIQINGNSLFRKFTRAVGRKCRTWENVPDYYVEVD
jgi:hypothetical protein